MPKKNMKLSESQSLEFNWKMNTAKYPSINITIISRKSKEKNWSFEEKVISKKPNKNPTQPKQQTLTGRGLTGNPKRSQKENLKDSPRTCFLL